MKLKTNKLLTLTLATGLVAMTAGCGGGTKTPATTGGNTGGGGTGPTVTDTVAYSDWSGDATIVAVDTNNAFLAGVAATSTTEVTLTGVTTGATVETLNLRSQVAAQVGTGNAITRTEETLGGVDGATNGVAFAHNGDSTPANLRYFAGLIAGTDLGAPLTTATATGTWAGLIQAVSGTTGSAFDAKAFELTVTFGSSDATRTISAHVAAGADFAGTSYLLSGTYDASGVITGTVSSGVIADTDPGRAAATETGTLSGLIGLNGAVGAFYSTATGATGFAGGFVASKAANLGGEDPDAVYADWSGSATLVTSATAANGFVAGTAAGLGVTALTAGTVAINLNTVVTPAGTGTAGTPEVPTAVQGANGAQLGGAATNGVAFASNGDAGARRYFAGLHLGTDLGRPLSAATVDGTWAGLFQAIGNDDHTTRTAFTLTVTFDANGDNTITGLVAANNNANAYGTDGDTSYYLSGTYDENGVITGSVLYGDFATGNADRPAALIDAASDLTDATATGATGATTNGRGVLSGLIGVDGAVGAFYSDGTDGTGLTGFAGGFVASKSPDTVLSPVAVVDYVVDYAKWAPTPAVLGAVPTTTGNGFLGAPSAVALTNAPSGAVYTSIDDTGVTGGVLVSTHVVAASTASFFAGLHNDTNLGAPVPTTGSNLVWTGPFAAVGAAGTYGTEEKDITLTIGLGTSASDRTITGSVPDGAAADTAFVANQPAYHVNGTYNTAGVISGFIRYSTDATAQAGVDAAVSTATTGLGTLTGLIGASGAVGAFISTGSDATGATGYAGGFVVQPGS